jgi:hypothetical protein
MAMYERRQLLLQKADPLGMTNKGQQLQLQVQLLVPKQIPFGMTNKKSKTESAG